MRHHGWALVSTEKRFVDNQNRLVGSVWTVPPWQKMLFVPVYWRHRRGHQWDLPSAFHVLVAIQEVELVRQDRPQMVLHLGRHHLEIDSAREFR